MSKTGLVIAREYRERVAKKSFIITTLLMPILMLGLMIAPALLMEMGGDTTTIMVVDNSGLVADKLTDDGDVRFVRAPQNLSVGDVTEMPADTINAMLIIPADVVDRHNVQLTMYSDGPAGVKLESSVINRVNDIVRDQRLTRQDIKDIDKILQEAEGDVSISLVRTDKDASEQASSEMSSILGMVLTFVLYMFLLLYGQMVMTSIIEEKNNRVLEVVVSSVRPTQLMLGKIIGIALTAVTQILIWGVVIIAIATFIIPATLSPEMMADIAAARTGNLESLSDPSQVSMLQTLGKAIDINNILPLLGIMTIYLVLGFLFYSSIYAAIGSSVDNIQDASQLQTIIIIPIVLGMICSMGAVASPDTGLAFWTSMIPFTSPMVMMARIPYGIPGWEVGTSLAVLLLSFLCMVWLAAKVYRVGIFMYGKKPSLRDLWMWIRYK